MDSSGYYSFSQRGLQQLSTDGWEFHTDMNLPDINTESNDLDIAMNDFHLLDGTSSLNPNSELDHIYSFDENTLSQGAATDLATSDRFAWNMEASNFVTRQSVFDLTHTDFSGFEAARLSDIGVATQMTQPMTGTQPDTPLSFVESSSGAVIHRSRFTSDHSMDGGLLGDVLSKWPGRCIWPGCESEAFLKTRKLLETHVYNLHVNPLVCDVPGCTYRKAFASVGDLERHKATRHERAGRFKCPDATCPRHVQGFSRKDKLKAHSKSHAPRILHCQYDHCEYHVDAERRKRFRSNNEHSIHQASHGVYECALGRCEGSSSSFTLEGLTQHFHRRHWWGCIQLFNKDNLRILLRGNLVLDEIGLTKILAASAPWALLSPDPFGSCSTCHRQSQRVEALLMPPPDESENIHA